MNVFKVAFIENREIKNHFEAERTLSDAISELIRTKEFVEFQLGRNGEFDIIAASCLKKVQHSLGNDNRR